MGYPGFLVETDIIEAWLSRARRAMDTLSWEQALLVSKVWSQFHAYLVSDEGSGSSAYLDFVWSLGREQEAETLFWELAEAHTESGRSGRYTEAFEILQRAEDVEVDEWGT